LSCLDKFIGDAIKAAETAPWGVDIKNYTPGSNYRVSGTGTSHGMGNNFASHLWAYLKQANGLTSGLETALNNSTIVQSDNKVAQAFLNCTGGYDGVTRKPTVYARYQIGGAIDFNENVDSYNLGNGCDAGTVYLKDDCSFVSLQAAQNSKNSKRQLCGNTKIDLTLSTPLSLVWSSAVTEEPSRIVSFKLNPHSEATRWMWRASSSLPLLVYDRDHTGGITSAEQLFGSWTFGGKHSASSEEKRPAATPWRDGYEALSTLDTDHDGAISGAELAPLGLWFDENRDGVSQSGEVKTLAEVSVKALYYNPDATEKGAIIANKGYERVVKGKVEVLPSIDWYEKALKAGPGELLESEGGAASDGARSDQIGEQVSEHRNSDTPRLFGVWGWTIDKSSDESSQGSAASGYLSLEAFEDKVFGATISQVDVSGDEKVAGFVSFKHFIGSVGKADTGQPEVKFTVKVASGATLTNTATLSTDGKTLNGKTVVTNSQESTTGSYEYTWNARRLTKY
jgi:hypothetical protein